MPFEKNKFSLVKILKRSLKQNIRFYLSLGLCFTLLFSLLNIITANATDSLSDIEKQYQDRQTEVSTQIGKIKTTLDEIASEKDRINEQKNTLSSQISSIKKEKVEIDKLITDTRLVITQIEKEIQTNQLEINRLNAEIKLLLREIQKVSNVSPMEILFSSENLGSALGRIYNLSTLQDRIANAKEEIEVSTEKLETNKKQNNEVKEQLERSRALLKSKESNLDNLLAQTNGEESKYAELINSIKEQKTELEAQLGSIKGEYLSHIEDLRTQEAQRTQKAQENSKAGCTFEEGINLNAPSGYFGKATTGYITQGFHCGHDGLDIANQMGTDIYSVADGVVERVGARSDGCVGMSCNGGFGNYIIIKHELPSNQTVYSLYAHMQKLPFKSVGQPVKKGDIIGAMGCTGFTKPYPCGVHLHFMLISDSYEYGGIGCMLGGSKCYNATKYIDPVS